MVRDGEAGRMPGSIAGEQFIVRDCEHATIFLLDNINTVTVDDCTDCTIVIGPTSGSVFLRECRGCTVVAACGQFRTRDCQQMDVRLLCGTQPIIEATSRIRFSCYQLSYPSLADEFRAAGLNPFNNNWSEVHDFTPVDGGKNWSVGMPAALSALKMPATHPLNTVGLSCERKSSVVPLTMGSVSPPSHGSHHNEEGVLLLIYHCPDQRRYARTIMERLYHVAGAGAVLYSREVNLSPTDAARVLGAATADDAKLHLDAGPVLALLLDAPYTAIMEAVSQEVREDLVHVSPDNGNGYTQANIFFSLASLSMAF